MGVHNFAPIHFFDSQQKKIIITDLSLFTATISTDNSTVTDPNFDFLTLNHQYKY